MLLRFFSALLVVIGAFPLIWSLRVMGDDPRRAAAVAGLSLIGITLHLLAAGDIRLRVRAALRLTALAAVGVMLLGVILGLRRLVLDVIPTLPLGQAAAREEFQRVVLGLRVLAAVLVYVGLAVLMMRSRPPDSTSRTGSENAS